MDTEGSSSPGDQPGDNPEPPKADSPESATAHSTRRGEVPLARPPDPIRPFLGRPLPPRWRRDWIVLIFALAFSGLLLVTCCLAGFAMYHTRSGLN
jgi:hypothetical protein